MYVRIAVDRKLTVKKTVLPELIHGFNTISIQISKRT